MFIQNRFSFILHNFTCARYRYSIRYSNVLNACFCNVILTYFVTYYYCNELFKFNSNSKHICNQQLKMILENIETCFANLRLWLYLKIITTLPLTRPLGTKLLLRRLRELRDSKACACSNSDLGEVLFYDVIFWDSK